MCGRFTLFEPDKILKKPTYWVRILDRNSSFGREERQKREGPAVIAGPSQNAGKFGVAFRSFGT
jgi:hypothetical protein